ncbi:plasmid mobilization protein [Staphylococcus caprae]|uniref:plasmid mobilization protein n=1 Tax=Staphylococcus caprae TaxID=29380 RepID=UPI000CD199D3|nr:hypothetical protein [Staphylococcus caprae]POA06075.1 hypothetical protein CD155_03780 [Staphylococcus caprae]SUL89853.1 Uncharacterised protein [Staphylococcus caprae]
MEKRRKDRSIAVRVTASQHKKIRQLASIRHMSIADYLRSTALGNQIKPTVVKCKDDSDEIIEQLKNDNEALKSNVEALKRNNQELKQHIYGMKGDVSKS